MTEDISERIVDLICKRANEELRGRSDAVYLTALDELADYFAGLARQRRVEMLTESFYQGREQGETDYRVDELGDAT